MEFINERSAYISDNSKKISKKIFSKKIRRHIKETFKKNKDLIKTDLVSIIPSRLAPLIFLDRKGGGHLMIIIK